MFKKWYIKGSKQLDQDQIYSYFNLNLKAIIGTPCMCLAIHPDMEFCIRCPQDYLDIFTMFFDTPIIIDVIIERKFR